jgi:hypothetical protein
MDKEDKLKTDDIVALAQHVLAYCELLIKQCDS